MDNYAQTSTLKPVIKRKKRIPPITEEMSFGGRLNSDGWGAYLERGFIKVDEGKTNFIWLELSEKKHPKESKQLNEAFTAIYPDQPAPLPYKYGKINNFYQLKLGYGQKRELTGKLDKKSIIISWVYGGGFSLGVIKPYYLDILVPEGNDLYTRQITDYYQLQTQPYFLDETLIVGGTYFTEGLSNFSLQPGLLAKSGFYFDYAPNRKSLLGIEIGSSLELYPKKIPIMANTTNNAYFLNLYVDVRFGKRWSRED